MEWRSKTTTNLRHPIIHDWFYHIFLLVFFLVEFNLGDKNMFGNKFPLLLPFSSLILIVASPTLFHSPSHSFISLMLDRFIVTISVCWKNWCFFWICSFVLYQYWISFVGIHHSLGSIEMSHCFYRFNHISCLGDCFSKCKNHTKTRMVKEDKVCEKTKAKESESKSEAT